MTNRLKSMDRSDSEGGWHSPYYAYRLLLLVYVITIYTILYTPLVMIAVLSFNTSEITGFPIKGFSLIWYKAVVSDPALLASFINSLGVATLAATISTTLALLLCLGFRHSFRGKEAVFNLILVPIIIPGIIGGIALLIFFGYLGIRSSLYTTVLAAHVNWALPFAFLTLYPRLHGFDKTLEEAAMDLGASSWQIFSRIVLPIVRPGIIATFLFSFTLSFDEFIRTIFLTGFDRTVPIQLWGMIVDEISPELPAMAVIIILVSAASALVGFAFSARATRRARQGAPE